jgi:ATP-dependent 26S proteasome regulatory subunit
VCVCVCIYRFLLLCRFEKNEGIIILAATNRRDYLDSALLRPGRFDSEIHISPPDLRGRKEIFELYLTKVTHDETVNTEYLAKGTTGFTGADIENMVNQVCQSCQYVRFNRTCSLTRLLCTLLKLMRQEWV